MEEFKFPDEVEQEKNVKLNDGDDITIEIEDDTPEVDRNVAPMPREIVEKLETADEDSEDLSPKDQKQRIQQYKKVFHDERRAKEAAMREQQEALELARRFAEENKRLKTTLSSGEKSYIETVQGAADLELDVAKRAYRDALDSGDPDRITETQVALNSAVYKTQQTRNFRPTPLQETENDVKLSQVEQQQPKIEPKTQSWLDSNPWYGSKKAMSSFAVGVHEELVDEYGSAVVGTDQYFRRIDQTMRKKFPEYFETLEDVGHVEPSKEDQAPSKTKPSTVVAPATRSTSSKHVKLKTTQMALIKKLGITPEIYAREQNKLEK
jgi:hypothetical protein